MQNLAAVQSGTHRHVASAGPLPCLYGTWMGSGGMQRQKRRVAHVQQPHDSAFAFSASLLLNPSSAVALRPFMASLWPLSVLFSLNVCFGGLFFLLPGQRGVCRSASPSFFRPGPGHEAKSQGIPLPGRGGVSGINTSPHRFSTAREKLRFPTRPWLNWNLCSSGCGYKW